MPSTPRKNRQKGSSGAARSKPATPTSISSQERKDESSGAPVCPGTGALHNIPRENHHFLSHVVLLYHSRPGTAKLPPVDIARLIPVYPPPQSGVSLAEPQNSSHPARSTSPPAVRRSWVFDVDMPSVKRGHDGQGPCEDARDGDGAAQDPLSRAYGAYPPPNLRTSPKPKNYAQSSRRLRISLLVGSCSGRLSPETRFSIGHVGRLARSRHRGRSRRLGRREEGRTEGRPAGRQAGK
jgi:hypothetical protein